MASQRNARLVEVKGDGAGEIGGHGQSLFLPLITGTLLFQLWLIPSHEFNWDEFYYLGFVHDYLRGEAIPALQTFHIHLFAPLAKLPGTEVDQLIVGRLAMLLFQIASLFALYSLCRSWTDRGPALFAVCAYVLMPTTLQHSASFRTDPLAIALAMMALACIARAQPTWRSAGLISLLVALAALVTVKVVFFAPAFAGVALWRASRQKEQRSAIRWLMTISLLAPIFFLLLYLAHQASLPHASAAESTAMMGGAARTTLVETHIFPRRVELIKSMEQAPVQWVLMLGGAVQLTIHALKGPSRAMAVGILGCVAPLLCLSIYRNAFPYFMPFITAPAFAAAAWFIQARRWDTTFQLLLATVMIATAAPSIFRIIVRDQSTQRAVISAVHEIFPKPVTMIDHSQMISSFPKRGFFMSTWGIGKYRRGPPIFDDILGRETVPLLLLDSPALEDAVGARPKLVAKYGLLESDRAVLSENYIEHWGPIWVAGKTLSVSPLETRFGVRIPGTYTLEGVDVRLDGRPVSVGEVVQLDRGMHRVGAASTGVATLRWGDHLRRPAAPPSRQPLYHGF